MNTTSVGRGGRAAARGGARATPAVLATLHNVAPARRVRERRMKLRTNETGAREGGAPVSIYAMHRSLVGGLEVVSIVEARVHHVVEHRAESVVDGDIEVGAVPRLELRLAQQHLVLGEV